MVVSALCGGTRSAWATCGDYLHHPQTSTATDRSRSPAVPEPVRCTGPHCRQAPATPAAPNTPITLRIVLDRWLQSMDGAAALLGPAVYFAPAEPDAQSIAGVVGSVDHVPRCV